MIVPNYVPPKLEVEGNVAQGRHAIRIRFLQVVVGLNAASLVGAWLVALAPLPSIGWIYAALMVTALLVLLDVWRIARRGEPIEAKISALALPLAVIAFGWLAREIEATGFPMWAVLLGPGFLLLYTLLAGRDFSFMGAFALAWIGSSVAVAALTVSGGLQGVTGSYALLANTIVLLYQVYDLSSVLYRRRVGEEWAAVVDLYRNVFNIFGYIPRLVHHWRRHHIWNEVREEVARTLHL